MKSAYWTWGAITADTALFVSPISFSSSPAAFIAATVTHASACAVIAGSAYLLLPASYRKPRLLVLLLMFGFAFIAPVVGPLGLLLIARTTLRSEEKSQAAATPRFVTLPEYNVQSRETKRGSQGAIRARLTSKAPSSVRMQSLLTLQAVPKRVANPILEDLLGDAEDDVRLVAFGMLDAEEKKISVKIYRERRNLEQALTNDQRRDCLRHLAELHWELIYASLAQGELRRFILSEAREYIDSALALTEAPDAGIHFLRGRILLAQGDVDKAEEAITLAVVFGQPEASVLPYLAEIAYHRRHFEPVRGLMQRLSELHVAPRTQAIVDLWTGRHRMNQVDDKPTLSHI